MKTIPFIMLFVCSLQASILMQPVESMQFAFGDDISVQKRNVLLTSTQASEVQKQAHIKLATKVYLVYKASKGEKTLGYGILVSQKVRSKNCVVMYHIANSKLLSIEIIAFNEPREYLPNKEWTQHFKNLSTDTKLYLTKEIPTITGATLSARSVTDASRIAFAIYNILLKGKE